MDWATLFRFDVPALELVVRGSAIYWFLLLVFRFVMRRDVGAVSTPDVLLIVLVADASQNAMAGSSNSIGEGLVLVSTLLGWNWLLDTLGYHVPLIARLIEAPPLLLVKNGHVLHRNLRREHITMADFASHLREAGIDDVNTVKAAYMEADGQFSVVRRTSDAGETHRRRRTPGA